MREMIVCYLVSASSGSGVLTLRSYKKTLNVATGALTSNSYAEQKNAKKGSISRSFVEMLKSSTVESRFLTTTGGAMLDLPLPLIPECEPCNYGAHYL